MSDQARDGELPAESPVKPVAPSRWVSASSELRSTAKWIIASLAAVAAVVFGAGPVVTRPSLDFGEDWLQLLISAALGAIGIIGIGVLIFTVSQLLLPIELSLNDLPKELLEDIGRDPQAYLPEGTASLTRFRDQLAAFRIAAVEIPDDIRQLERVMKRAQETGNTAAYSAAFDERTAYERALNDAAANLKVFESVRADLIDRGAYVKLSQLFSDHTRALWVGALMAGIGGLGFQLALTAAPDQDSDAEGSNDSPAGIAVLTPRAAGQDFWDSYHLEDCANTVGQVPVLIRDGEGTEDSPFIVETIPSAAAISGGACPHMLFNVNTAGRALAVTRPEPNEVTIKYEEEDDDKD